MSNRNSQTTFAIFDSFAWADEAAKFLKVWVKSQPEMKFEALTLVYETYDGQIKVRNHGPRNTLEGAEVGLILGIVAGRMAGIPLLRGILGGAVVGAAIGSLVMQPPGLAPEELQSLRTDLAGGKAGLVIRLDRAWVDRVRQEIAKLDGEIKKYDVRSQVAGSVSSVPAPITS
jgi:uncharacterized membrane protein